MGYLGSCLGTPSPGDHIEVYWDGDNEYYGGRVIEKGLRGMCVVKYDDNETIEEDLLAMTWRLSPLSTDETRQRLASYEKSWKRADSAAAAAAARTGNKELQLRTLAHDGIVGCDGIGRARRKRTRGNSEKDGVGAGKVEAVATTKTDMINEEPGSAEPDGGGDKTLAKRRRRNVPQSATGDTFTADKLDRALPKSEDQAAPSSLSRSNDAPVEVTSADKADVIVASVATTLVPKDARRHGSNSLMQGSNSGAGGDRPVSADEEDENKSEKQVKGRAAPHAHPRKASMDTGNAARSESSDDGERMGSKSEVSRLKKALADDNERSSAPDDVIEPDATANSTTDHRRAESGPECRTDAHYVEKVVRRAVKGVIENAMNSIKETLSNDLALLSDELLGTVMRSLF